MKRAELVKKFKERAKRNQKLRKDPRYKNVLGLLTQIGFLNANRDFPAIGNRHVPLRDAIWAGTTIEPRILEVLPAAFARLPKRFDWAPHEAIELNQIIQCFKENRDTGPDFFDVPYEKLKSWYHLPLPDRRTKTPEEKKIARNFRLNPKAIEKLEERAKRERISVTALIEKLAFAI